MKRGDEIDGWMNKWCRLIDDGRAEMRVGWGVEGWMGWGGGSGGQVWVREAAVSVVGERDGSASLDPWQSVLLRS